MSLNKRQEERVKWIEENMPAESMDPDFPYIIERALSGIGKISSPAGFVPNHFKAHNSIGGLPESLQKDD